MAVRLETRHLGYRLPFRAKLCIAGAGSPPVRPDPSAYLPCRVTRAMQSRRIALEHESLRITKTGQPLYGPLHRRIDSLSRRTYLAEEGLKPGPKCGETRRPARTPD